MFLWLVEWRKLLTNESRVQRHLTHYDICDMCGMGREDVLHVLRGCMKAKVIWLMFIPSNEIDMFFSSLDDWLNEIYF